MLTLGENVYSQGAAKIRTATLDPYHLHYPSWPTRSITVFINLLYVSNVPPAFQPGLALPYPLLTDCSAIHCLISFQYIKEKKIFKENHKEGLFLISEVHSLIFRSNSLITIEYILLRG